ncbi:MAG TPA: hypothetical protein VFX98_01855 [Longimicrobiaceae bacterium]|nr:hypothetical protein [Longimicrobiaceae bacterium]
MLEIFPMKLNLDDLRVDAFETTPADTDGRGTVHALEMTEGTCDPTCEWSCAGTCRLSCLPTCHYDMLTCGDTCNCA